jgi:hypothetical protein
VVHHKTYPSHENVQTPVAETAAFICQLTQAMTRIGIIPRPAAIAVTGSIRADQPAGVPLAQLMTFDACFTADLTIKGATTLLTRSESLPLPGYKRLAPKSDPRTRSAQT